VYHNLTLPLIPSHQGRGKSEAPIKGGERKRFTPIKRGKEEGKLISREGNLPT